LIWGAAFVAILRQNFAELRAKKNKGESQKLREIDAGKENRRVRCRNAEQGN